MALAEVLSVLLWGICSFVVLASSLFIMWYVYSAFSRTDLPPGFNQRLKLQFYCILFKGMFVLVSIPTLKAYFSMKRLTFDAQQGIFSPIALQFGGEEHASSV